MNQREKERLLDLDLGDKKVLTDEEFKEIRLENAIREKKKNEHKDSFKIELENFRKNNISTH